MARLEYNVDPNGGRTELSHTSSLNDPSPSGPSFHLNTQYSGRAAFQIPSVESGKTHEDECIPYGRDHSTTSQKDIPSQILLQSNVFRFCHGRDEGFQPADHTRV